MQQDNYFKDRQANILKANRHVKYMDESFRMFTKSSSERSDFFRQLPGDLLSKCTGLKCRELPEIVLTCRSTTDVVFEDSMNALYSNITVLDFADYLKPGGMFMEGSMAQEESLCHKSNLYNILTYGDQFSDHFADNKEAFRRSGNHAYSDACIMIPSVMFADDDIRPKRRTVADVIIIAAPNKRHLDTDNLTDSDFDYILRKRIEMIFKASYMFYKKRGVITEDEHVNFGKSEAFHLFMFDDNGHNIKQTLVLGAFGCGVFRNDPYRVAEIMMDCISKGYANMYDRVIFAIPPGYNHDAFSRVIKQRVDLD